MRNDAERRARFRKRTLEPGHEAHRVPEIRRRRNGIDFDVEARGAERPAFAGIYGIVDLALSPAPLDLLAALLAGGIRIVQYRAKAGVDRSVVRAMHALTQARGAFLIVNDDLDAALEADGWHAGQEDLAGRDPREVRARLRGRIFGVSCGVPDEARAAESFGADYVGVGPFAATGTKADAGDAIGIAGIAAVVRATRVPVVAIGGIDAANLADVIASGASMAAVVSAVARAPDPAGMARRLVAAWAHPSP